MSTNGDVKCDKAMHLKAELLFGKWQFSSQLQPPVAAHSHHCNVWNMHSTKMWIEINVDTQESAGITKTQKRQSAKTKSGQHYEQYKPEWARN